MKLINMIISDIQREKEIRRLEQKRSIYAASKNYTQLRKVPTEENHTLPDIPSPSSDPGKSSQPEADPETMEEADLMGLLHVDEYTQDQFFSNACNRVSRFCEKHSLTYEIKDSFIYITTDIGKWYFHPNEAGETTLYHKNYELRRNQAETYHVQFTKSLTVDQILSYILRHDNAQKRRKEMYS